MCTVFLFYKWLSVIDGKIKSILKVFKIYSKFLIFYIVLCKLIISQINGIIVAIIS